MRNRIILAVGLFLTLTLTAMGVAWNSSPYVHLARAQALAPNPTPVGCTINVGPFLNGPAQQEQDLLCNHSGNGGMVMWNIEPSNTPTANPNALNVARAAINCAENTTLVIGTPKTEFPSVDWAGSPIEYLEFSSAYHAEWHTFDNAVRIYNETNQHVC